VEKNDFLDIIYINKRLIMNASERFYQDLGDGKKGERAISNFLKENGYITGKQSDGADWDFRVKMGDVIKSIEVKTDRWAHFKETSRWSMYIETTHKGKVSGVSSTKADYFVYYFPYRETAFIFDTEKLREAMNSRGDIFVRRPGGYNKTCMGCFCLIDNIRGVVPFKEVKIKRDIYERS
jgi:hypothetical protein